MADRNREKLKQIVADAVADAPPDIRAMLDDLAEDAGERLAREPEAEGEIEAELLRMVEGFRLAAALEGPMEEAERAEARARLEALVAEMQAPARPCGRVLSKAALVLREAIDDGDLEAIAAALDGVDLNEAQDQHGSVPLHWALTTEARSVATVSLLLAHGARADHTTSDGYTPLHFVPDTVFPDFDPAETVRIVGALVAAGADIEARQHLGWTPLHRAVVEGTAPELAALLAHGADANALFSDESLPCDTPGRLPLMIAAHDPEKVRLLLEHGADPEARDAHGTSVRAFVAAEEARLTRRLARLEQTGGADRYDRMLTEGVSVSARLIQSARRPRLS